MQNQFHLLSTKDSTLGTSSTLSVSVEDSGITTVAQATLQETGAIYWTHHKGPMVMMKWLGL